MSRGKSEPTSSAVRTVVVAPTRGWRALNLGELWEFRELWWVLALRDLKVRYRQTLLGVVWAIAPPLATVAIFNQLFGLLMGTENKPSVGAAPYVVSTYCAMLPWQLFARVFAHGGDSLVGNRHLITKVYFPRLLLPLAPAGVALVDFAIGSAALALMMAVHGVTPTWRLLVAPFFALLAVTTGVAVALWLSAANAVYRDIRHMMGFVLQAMMFVTPVLYSTESIADSLPRWGHWLYGLNPMVAVIEGFRWATLGGEAPSSAALVASGASSLLIAVGGLYFFRRMERSLTDVI